MNSDKLNLIKKTFDLEIEPYQSTIFDQFEELILKKNKVINLISKNDEKYFFEKHIFDSLALNLFFKKYGFGFQTLLDIGTGGGLPAVPISIMSPLIKIFAIDSIGKKIRFVEDIKMVLGLENLIPIANRVENINETFDLITVRAVSKIEILCKYALPRLNQNGYMILYKSKTVREEISAAQKILDKFNAKVLEIINYTLPLKEPFSRNLVVITKY